MRTAVPLVAALFLVLGCSAVFVKAEIDSNTSERDSLAFSDISEAVEYGKTRGASPVDWPAIVRQVAAAN